ncbi:MAG: pseudouridine synthase [Clostridium sp.]|nr:pseudouridine synthase [Clostridium sp.]
MGNRMRLDKFLTEMKQGSRSQVKELIRKGRVTVDGIVCRNAEEKIDPDCQAIHLDQEPVGWAAVEYYLLNKPQGVVSATEDPRYPTVVELIGDAKRKDLFPVGRLDIDTEGLLLLTNDGALAHELLSPKKHVDKVYFARVRGTLDSDIEARMEAGMVLKDGTRVRPAQLIIEQRWKKDGEDLCEARLTIHEGKFHQVKRMFEAAGGEVMYLKRLSMGPLTLDASLLPGQYRPLSAEEIKALKEINR